VDCDSIVSDPRASAVSEGVSEGCIGRHGTGTTRCGGRAAPDSSVLSPGAEWYDRSGVCRPT